jgi:DNA-binding transcriptional LysR family regulator
MATLDDLNLLRTFVRIAEAGSISAAARSLHTTQPTLSRQLQQLESLLDAPLVQRDSHRMSLTAAGQRMLVDAREILDHVQAATLRANGEQSAPRGHLRVVTTIDMGQYHVAPLLARLREQCPQLTAEMHVTNRPVKFVEEGFDCGVLVGAITDDTLVAKRLLENPRVLVAAPELVKKLGMPEKPGDLKAWPWVGLLGAHFLIDNSVPFTNGGKTETVNFDAALRLDGVTSMRAALLAGAGVAVLPLFMVREAVAAGTLQRLLEDWIVPPVAFHAVYLASPFVPAKVRAFVDLCVQEMPGRFDEVSSDLTT